MVGRWREVLLRALRVGREYGPAGFRYNALDIFSEHGMVRRIWLQWRTLGGWELQRRVLQRARAQFRYWQQQRKQVQAARARTLAKELQVAADRGRAEECQKLLAAAFRKYKARGASIAMTSLHEGDSLSGRLIRSSDPAHARAAGAIGALKQEVLLGAGTVPEAFQAWCAMWMQKWEELRLEDGEAWTLEGAITFDVFDRTLARITKGKAAGAGGVRLEALARAPLWIRRRFWQGTLACARTGVFPPEWYRVEYVLLEKKYGSQALVGNRREIALMPQDMKLLCACIKVTAYSRMAGRIDHAQLGFCAGTGAMDGGLLAGLLLQAQRRKRAATYMLYIDISKFFPSIDRTVLTVAQAWHGLPVEVQRITAALMGEMTGAFDSAHGLGDDFDIYMGALMGCVLSPDKAKLLLNTVVVAIRAYVRGVRLAGCAGRTVASVCYCDDWLGVHESEADLWGCWHVWRTWSLVSGCKLGVDRDCAKTCFVAARWEGDKLVDVPLARGELRTMEGDVVPRLKAEQLYVHLGVPRSADGGGAGGRQQVRKKMREFIARARVMRSLRAEEFVEVSNAIVVGIGGFLGASTWMSWVEADKVEGWWRAEYRRRYGGALSTPRLFYYEDADGQTNGRGLRREHLFTVMAASLYETMAKAMGDRADTDLRCVARSEVASAAWRWGCRKVVSQWRAGGAADCIEVSLAERHGDWLGEAFWLVRAWVEQARAAPEVQDWELRQLLEADDALRSTWTRRGSLRVWEPVTQGGLGLRTRGSLVKAELVEVGDFCHFNRHGAAAWMPALAATAAGRIPDCSRARAEWDAVVQELMALGPRVAPVVTRSAGRPRDDGGPEEDLRRVDEAALARFEQGLRETRSARGTAAQPRAQVAQGAAWSGADETALGRQLQAAFMDARPRPAVEWAHGVHSEATAAKLVFRMPQELTLVDEGWRTPGPRRGLHDSAEWSIDKEANVCFQGQPVADAADWWGLTQDGVAVPPLAALHSMARAVLHEQGAELRAGAAAAATRAGARAAQQEGNFVDVERTRSEWADMWQMAAAHDITACWCTDGSRRWDKDLGSHRAARVAIRHCGRRAGGRMEAADSYHTEMAALIDALHSETESRVMIVLDASSPALALRKWLELHDRRRGAYYLDQELATLEQALNKFEVVVFFWTSSHKGVVINELADVEAGEHLLDETCAAVWRAGGAHATVGLGAKRSNRAEALSAVRSVVLRRLRAASVHSVWQTDDDWAAPKGSALLEHVTRAAAGRRWALGDEKATPGELGEHVRAAGCPCCGAARHDWIHVVFVCDGLRAQREVLFDRALALRGALDGTGAPHEQAAAFVDALRGGTGRPMRPKLWRPPGAAHMRMQTQAEADEAALPVAGSDAEVAALRGLCGLWDKPAMPEAGARDKALATRLAWLGLAQVYDAAAAIRRTEVRESLTNSRALAAAFARMQATVVAAGADRIEGVRRARQGAAAAWEALRTSSEDKNERLLARLRAFVRTRGQQIRTTVRSAAAGERRSWERTEAGPSGGWCFVRGEGGRLRCRVEIPEVVAAGPGCWVEGSFVGAAPRVACNQLEGVGMELVLLDEGATGDGGARELRVCCPMVLRVQEILLRRDASGPERRAHVAHAWQRRFDAGKERWETQAGTEAHSGAEAAFAEAEAAITAVATRAPELLPVVDDTVDTELRADELALACATWCTRHVGSGAVCAGADAPCTYGWCARCWVETQGVWAQVAAAQLPQRRTGPMTQEERLRRARVARVNKRARDQAERAALSFDALVEVDRAEARARAQRRAAATRKRRRRSPATAAQQRVYADAEATRAERAHERAVQAAQDATADAVIAERHARRKRAAAELPPAQATACTAEDVATSARAEARVRFDAGLSALGGASWAAAVAASEVAEQQERQAKRRREAAAPGERSREYARSRAARLERERRGQLATFRKRERLGSRVVLYERPRQAPERRRAVVARDEVTHYQLG